MKSSISIMGLYMYDDTLFDTIILPHNVQKDDVVNNILLECADLELVWPDWDFMHGAINVWSKALVNKWQKLYYTEHLDYNPIENYNRREEWEDNGENAPNYTSTSIDYTIPYADTTMQQRDKNETSSGGRGTTKSTHTGHVSGNIGVTTTQQMLEQERKIADFSLYEVIAQDFKTRFCIAVY